MKPATRAVSSLEIPGPAAAAFLIMVMPLCAYAEDTAVKKEAKQAVHSAGEAARHVARGAKDVAEDVADGAKKAGKEVGAAAKKVGTEVADGAKKIAGEVAEGAKKAGGEVKKAVTGSEKSSKPKSSSAAPSS
jgi:hypothetical protein